MLHAGGGPANTKLPGNNGATTLENRDLTTEGSIFKPETSGGK